MFVAESPLMLCGHNVRLRGDRILGPACENTACSEDDLAQALSSRQVMLQGTFVRALRGA